MNRRLVVAGSVLVVSSCIAYGIFVLPILGFLASVSDWPNDRRLLISYVERRKIGRQQTAWRDVRIEYEGPCETHPGESCNSDRIIL